jgi:hypothetical protein
MKFAALFSSLAKKSGLDVTAPEFAPLLAHDIEIPDDIATKIDTALMNEAVAKTKFKTVHRTEALNGVDSKIDELLTELGYSDEEISEVKEEKNSYEKVAKLVRSVKTLESKKVGTKGEAKEALEKKIEDLNKEIKAAKQLLTDKETEFKTVRDGDLTNFEIQKLLLGKEYSLPKEMDPDLKLSTAHGAINKALSAKGLKLVRNDQGQLSIVDKDGNKAYSDNHEEIQVANFIDGALAQNKLLKVVDDQSQSGGGNNPGQTQTITGTGGQQGNQQTVAAIDSQMKELGLV